MGFPITRRKSPENALVVMPKDPINTANKNVIVGRAENVFLRVDNNPIIPYIEMSRTIVVKLLTMTGL